jgi:hypothetical protein
VRGTLLLLLLLLLGMGMVLLRLVLPLVLPLVWQWGCVRDSAVGVKTGHTCETFAALTAPLGGAIRTLRQLVEMQWLRAVREIHFDGVHCCQNVTYCR